MTSQHKVSRRTVAKGAAWSVPVVAVAAAAPAASASTNTCATDAACIVAAPPVGVLPGLTGAGTRALSVMTFIAGISVANCSDLISAAVVVGIDSATGTDAAGNSYSPSLLSLTAGAGVDLLGANVGPIIVAATWPSSDANNAITKVCATFNIEITLNLDGSKVTCPVSLCWNTPSGLLFAPTPA